MRSLKRSASVTKNELPEPTLNGRGVFLRIAAGYQLAAIPHRKFNLTFVVQQRFGDFSIVGERIANQIGSAFGQGLELPAIEN